MLLERALAWKAEPETGRLQSFVYLFENDDDELVFNTTTSSITTTDASWENTLKKLVPRHPNVVLADELLDTALAARLHRTGINFARTFSYLVKSHSTARPKVKLLFVISTEPEQAAAMFPGQPKSAVARALAVAREAESEGLGLIVNTKNALTKALDSLKPDERAVICYHGSDTIVLSDTTLPVEDLTEQGFDDRYELLSCDTWRLPPTGLMSLDKIDLENTFKAALNTVRSHVLKPSPSTGGPPPPKGPPPPPKGPPPTSGGGSLPPPDFGGGVADNYAALHAEDKKKQYLIVAVIVGGVAIGYYIITQDEDSAQPQTH